MFKKLATPWAAVREGERQLRGMGCGVPLCIPIT